MYRTVLTICTVQWSLYVPHSGHYMYRTVLTICTVQCSLYVPHSGHYMYRTVVTICTAQWSLYVPHNGHYMYRQFNIQQFYVLPTQCIYVFCVDLSTNSHYFPIQHQLTGLYNRDGVCLLRGTDWCFKCNSDLIFLFKFFRNLISLTSVYSNHT